MEKLWNKIKSIFGHRGNRVNLDISKIIGDEFRLETDTLNNIKPPDNKFNIDIQGCIEAGNASNLALLKELAETRPELFVQHKESEVEKKISEMLEKSREDVLVKVYRPKNQRPENNSTSER